MSGEADDEPPRRVGAGLVVWSLTTGEAGMRTQAHGLAAAVAQTAIAKVARHAGLWRHAPAGTPFLLSCGLAADSDPLAPPWPDLVVSCGRRAAALALAIQDASGGAAALVHVQDPQAMRSRFDLIIAMPHDRLSGPNVLTVPTALHDHTPQSLARAAAEWAPRFAALPRPHVGVLLGGATRSRPFTVADADRLIAGLERVQAEAGGSVLIVSSRRTPIEVVTRFAVAACVNPRLWLWHGEGENPYRGLLALADRLVVTADSISMVSEALATGHPVEVFLGALGRRHGHFVQGLLDAEQVRAFTGAPQPPPARLPIDANRQAIARVRAILAERASRSAPAESRRRAAAR